jgi:endoglucanase
MGIPLRYMHTPVEMVAIKDIQRAGRLLAEFISGMQLDFMENISWEN